MSFPESWLSELKNRNDIVSVVDSYVRLTKKGGRYWACCPFHHEKTASFSVTPDKQIFYCFSCKKGGDVIKFVMEMDRLTYPEAVEVLAQRVGMSVPAQTKDDEDKREYKKRLCQVMKDAAKFYYATLNSEEGKVCLDYLTRRGLEPVIKKLGLGYSPSDFERTIKHMTSLGYTHKELIDCGLAKQKDGRVYDTFRGRAMFPIMNVMGEIIAFGGRVIGEGEPKYLNSSETLIFNKRKNLYALNIVKSQKQIKSILLLEGYADVASLLAEGIGSAVASLGTAFTREQARLIKRYSTNVYLCYDGDDAGVSAALRACPILEAEGLSVKVIELPEKLDPDDFVRKYGKTRFYELAAGAKLAFAFKLSRISAEFDLKSPDGKIGYCNAAIAEIAKIENSVVAEMYTRQVSRETGISESSLNAQISGDMNKTPLKVAKFPNVNISGEKELIVMLLANPELSGIVDIKPDDFSIQLYREIFIFLKLQTKKGVLTSVDELLENTGHEQEVLELLATELSPVLDIKERLAQLIKHTKIATLRERCKQIGIEITKIDGEHRTLLLTELEKLNKEIYFLNR